MWQRWHWKYVPDLVSVTTSLGRRPQPGHGTSDTPVRLRMGHGPPARIRTAAVKRFPITTRCRDGSNQRLISTGLPPPESCRSRNSFKEHTSASNARLAEECAGRGAGRRTEQPGQLRDRQSHGAGQFRDSQPLPRMLLDGGDGASHSFVHFEPPSSLIQSLRQQCLSGHGIMHVRSSISFGGAAGGVAGLLVMAGAADETVVLGHARRRWVAACISGQAWERERQTKHWLGGGVWSASYPRMCGKRPIPMRSDHSVRDATHPPSVSRFWNGGVRRPESTRTPLHSDGWAD